MKNFVLKMMMPLVLMVNMIDGMSQKDMLNMHKVDTLEQARNLLGVPENFNIQDIDSAFRKFSQKYHPDKFPQTDQGQKEAHYIYQLGGQAKDLLMKELKYKEKRSKEKIDLEKEMDVLRKKTEAAMPTTLEKAARYLRVNVNASPEKVKRAYDELVGLHKKHTESSDPLKKLNSELFIKIFNASYDFFNKHFEDQKKKENQKQEPKKQEEPQGINAWLISIKNDSSYKILIKVTCKGISNPIEFRLDLKEDLYIPSNITKCNIQKITIETYGGWGYLGGTTPTVIYDQTKADIARSFFEKNMKKVSSKDIPVLFLKVIGTISLSAETPVSKFVHSGDVFELPEYITLAYLQHKYEKTFSYNDVIADIQKAQKLNDKNDVCRYVLQLPKAKDLAEQKKWGIEMASAMTQDALDMIIKSLNDSDPMDAKMKFYKELRKTCFNVMIK